MSSTVWRKSLSSTTSQGRICWAETSITNAVGWSDRGSPAVLTPNGHSRLGRVLDGPGSLGFGFGRVVVGIGG